MNTIKLLIKTMNGDVFTMCCDKTKDISYLKKTIEEYNPYYKADDQLIMLFYNNYEIPDFVEDVNMLKDNDVLILSTKNKNLF
jgi:hypothetical protein